MLKSVKIVFLICTNEKIGISLHYQITIKNNNNGNRILFKRNNRKRNSN